MKPHIEKQVREHGENLNAIFRTSHDPIKLCRALRRIEQRANRLARALCNGEIDDISHETNLSILNAVDKLLNCQAQSIPVFFNKDPRGYALKIKSEYVSEHNLKIHKDWGGYGILAPKFD